MKTHILTAVSLGIKNLFGLLPCKNKSIYHIYIHDFLFALLKRFQPHLTILDGIVGMEGMGPIFGQPANAKIVLASEDVVSLDAIAAKIIGFDPYNIPYLKMAIDYRCGNKHFSGVSIQGCLRNLNFKSPQTLPTQIIRALSENGNYLEHLMEQIDAPLQTIKNLPTFIDSLISQGIIVRTNGKLYLDRSKLELLYSLFPEIEREFPKPITDIKQLMPGGYNEGRISTIYE